MITHLGEGNDRSNSGDSLFSSKGWGNFPSNGFSRAIIRLWKF